MGNFSDIYGYETIKEHLQSAISMGKVSHAYVISGGLGSGKKLIASTFAQTLQCEAGGVEPCGVCHSCVQAAGRNQPDIIWVGHEKPGSIGVDDIRDQLVSDMQIKPYSSPYKIYIIDEADKLTVAAQLKSHRLMELLFFLLIIRMFSYRLFCQDALCLILSHLRMM